MSGHSVLTLPYGLPGSCGRLFDLKCLFMSQAGRPGQLTSPLDPRPQTLDPSLNPGLGPRP
eukprot:2640634-Rhodomonas_salina.3